jgi:hypothetical protein
MGSLSMSFLRSRLVLWTAAFCTILSAAAPPLPRIARIYPLGGLAGSEVTVEILGDRLSNVTTVEFDCKDLAWRRTIESSAGRVKGVIAVAPHAPLGPHMLRASTKDGYSTSVMFNVDQFPSVVESEPNDVADQAQAIDAFPAAVQGRLDGAEDRDFYSIRARKGERRIFDLRSIESGSAVEARMFLLDEQGHKVSFNDDRDDIDENPLIEHTFEKDGKYVIGLDQYRGPRGFNFGKSNAYILRISSLARIEYTSPLGLRSGQTTRIRIFGSALETIRDVYLTESRRGEYTRITYPYTIPLHFREDPESAGRIRRIEGKPISREPGVIEAEFTVPADARAGLWRLWASGQNGISDGPPLEISASEEFGETAGIPAPSNGSIVINGSIDKPGEKDVYRVPGTTGRPIRFWTLATQLGVPRLDSVLTLRDASGTKLAENDDVVAGQGTLLGNPDSSLYYTPKSDGPLFLTVSDRVNRGGPDFQYRLKVAAEKPGFQLFTTPENFTVARGGSGSVKVHLVREAGFEGEVEVWFEGMPPGVESPKGKFRADQLFEPNADGADMIIPEIEFAIRAPESMAPGTYPVRIFGSGENGPKVEAQGAVLMGPLLDLWNFVRRPLPAVTMTVVEPFEAKLAAEKRSLTVMDGESVALKLKAEKIPADAVYRLANAPAGVTHEIVERSSAEVSVKLSAAPDAAPGRYEVSVEAKVGDRWAASEVITLSVQKAEDKHTGN